MAPKTNLIVRIFRVDGHRQKNLLSQELRALSWAWEILNWNSMLMSRYGHQAYTRGSNQPGLWKWHGISRLFYTRRNSTQIMRTAHALSDYYSMQFEIVAIHSVYNKSTRWPNNNLLGCWWRHADFCTPEKCRQSQNQSAQYPNVRTRAYNVKIRLPRIAESSCTDIGFDETLMWKRRISLTSNLLSKISE